MATSTDPTMPPAIDEPRYPLESQKITELVRHLVNQVSTLFRQELSLATAELSRSLTALIVGVTSVAVAGALLFAGLLVLLFAAVAGLALVLPAWLAAVVVGVVVVLIGGSLLSVGVTRFKAATVPPKGSAESLRKDKDVLTRRTS
ncbi:MAG TPA: phage holin family protein [Steroidobacteraceae bacterium]